MGINHPVKHAPLHPQLPPTRSPYLVTRPPCGRSTAKEEVKAKDEVINKCRCGEF